MTPIYQTSTFRCPDVAAGVAIWKGEESGYIYSHLGNSNLDQPAQKIAMAASRARRGCAWALSMGLICLSVGIEKAEDILADLDQALI